jgi:FMN phosphatase YigB (HAD superfamily)
MLVLLRRESTTVLGLQGVRCVARCRYDAVVTDRPTLRKSPRLLITDLDNTLWDWFAAWHSAFNAMLDRLSALSGISRDVLEKEIRPVHQARGTSEYSNLLNELPSLLSQVGDSTPLEIYDDAIHVMNAARIQATKLYPGVKDALHKLQGAGVKIVAYTESVAYWTEWRIKHTGLDGVIQALYSAPDHDLPDGITIDHLRRRPSEAYGLKVTDHRHVPRGNEKPNAAVLASILQDMNCESTEAIYVGDSLLKDIRMAQTAGVLDAHAKYGEVQGKAEYDLLRKVSHWPDEVVSKERELMDSRDIEPTIVLERGFDEILPTFGLER